MALFGDTQDPAVSLREHFPNATDPTSLDTAISWGRKVLDEAKVSPAKSTEAVAALRQADSGLALKPAMYLVRLLNDEVARPGE